MTTRDDLHQLIDKLSDHDHDLELVGADLRARDVAHESHAPDDEPCKPWETPLTDEEIAATDLEIDHALAQTEKYAAQNKAAYAALLAAAYPPGDDSGADVS